MSFKLQEEKRLVLREKGKINIVDISKISHISCQGYLSTVHAFGDKQYKVARLLKNFESDLSDYGFIRISHNTIVNRMHISKIISNSLGVRAEINGFELSVSRRKLKALKHSINAFV